MSNRRSLIGEVSLPKISEKVWNRINVELFDDKMGKSYSAIVNLDYAVSNDTCLIVSLSDSFGNSFRIEDSFGTYHTFTGHFLGSSQGVTVASWTPLEDDNYKYIVFPMHLVVGDNGDKGKMLYEYLTSKYPDGGADLSEKIYVDGDIMPYLNSGYTLTAARGFYKLDANGLITYRSHSGDIN